MYLNQRGRFDVQNAFLEDTVDNGLTCIFTYMGIGCNPTSVPREVFTQLPPTLILLHRRGDTQDYNVPSDISMDPSTKHHKLQWLRNMMNLSGKLSVQESPPMIL